MFCKQYLGRFLAPQDSNSIVRAWRTVSAIGILICSTSAFSAERVLVDQNAKKTSAYVLLQAEMIDQAMFFRDYAIPAEVEVDRNGGHAEVATFGKTVMEGVWNNNWTIVLHFPSMQKATTWYYSPKYQAVVPYRHAATAYGNMVFFESVPESVVDWTIATYQGAQPQLKFPLTLDPTLQFVVTVFPNWTSHKGSCAIRAGFTPADLRGALASFEIKLADGSLPDQVVTGALYVRDTAGNRLRLGEIDIRGANIGWKKFQVRIPARSSPSFGSDGRELSIDLSNINAIEFQFHATPASINSVAALQIENLSVVKDH